MFDGEHVDFRIDGEIGDRSTDRHQCSDVDIVEERRVRGQRSCGDPSLRIPDEHDLGVASDPGIGDRLAHHLTHHGVIAGHPLHVRRQVRRVDPGLRRPVGGGRNVDDIAGRPIGADDLLDADLAGIGSAVTVRFAGEEVFDVTRRLLVRRSQPFCPPHFDVGGQQQSERVRAGQDPDRHRRRVVRPERVIAFGVEYEGRQPQESDDDARKHVLDDGTGDVGLFERERDQRFLRLRLRFAQVDAELFGDDIVESGGVEDLRDHDDLGADDERDGNDDGQAERDDATGRVAESVEQSAEDFADALLRLPVGEGSGSNGEQCGLEFEHRGGQLGVEPDPAGIEVERRHRGGDLGEQGREVEVSDSGVDGQIADT